MGSGSVTSHGKGKSHEFKVKEAKKIIDYLKPSRKSHGKGKSHEFKIKEAKKIIDYLKPSRKTQSSNLSSNVAPKGLDTNTQSNSYVQPTALANLARQTLCGN